MAHQTVGSNTSNSNNLTKHTPQIAYELILVEW